MNILKTEKRIENQDDLRKAAEDIMECAIEELKETGTVEPKFFFFTEDGEMYVASILWEDDQGKRLARGQAALLAKELEAKQVIFLSDAFMGPIDGPPPSRASKQRLAILLTAEYGENRFGILQKYRRKRGEKKIKIGKRLEVDDLIGPFTGILEDQHVTGIGRPVEEEASPTDEPF